MARGFGATFGPGLITSALSSDSVTRSYFHRFTTHVTGIFNNPTWAQSDGVSKITYFVGFSTSGFQFKRQWSTGDGVWHWIGRPAVDTWTSQGVSYDASSTTNNPVVYVDGTKPTVTKDGTPSGTLVPMTTNIILGGWAADTPNNWDGLIADFAVWDVILTDAEFFALTNGYSPAFIRPQSLVEYIPMIRSNVSLKLAAPTIGGTPSVQPQPRVILPRRTRIRRSGLIPDTTSFGIRGFADTAF